ncbi:hypothetical protein ACFLWU_04915 [Chloroflexota bacterium]
MTSFDLFSYNMDNIPLIRRNPVEEIIDPLIVCGLVPQPLREKIEEFRELLWNTRMQLSEEIGKAWKLKAEDLLLDCVNNLYNLPDELKTLHVAAAFGLKAGFYVLFEENPQEASINFEEAAKQLEDISEETLSDVMKNDTTHTPTEESISHYVGYFRLGAIGLWDSAGDNYALSEGRLDDAQRCYEKGINIIESYFQEDKNNSANTLITHLKLSLADLLLSNSDDWPRIESLYREAADSIISSHNTVYSNSGYLTLCKVISDKGDGAVLTLPTSEYEPHVIFPVSQSHKERFLELKADFGLKALDRIKSAYENGKRSILNSEKFPVPEIYYLLSILSDLLLRLRQYNECSNLIDDDSEFGKVFWEWTLDGLNRENKWSYSLVSFIENTSYAGGLIERPDYNEFVETIKKTENSHLRQEIRLLKHEQIIKRLEKHKDMETTQKELLQNMPWLRDTSNLGSVVNAEYIYSQLNQASWSEAVMGYSNAVEEEIKDYLYRRYLEYRAGSSREFVEDSKRQRKPELVLSFVAYILKDEEAYNSWKHFSQEQLPEHYDFLSIELPKLLKKLIGIRNPSAHGKMSDKQRAEKVRQLVMGSRDNPGLLEKLAKLRNSSCKSISE